MGVTVNPVSVWLSLPFAPGGITVTQAWTATALRDGGMAVSSLLARAACEDSLPRGAQCHIKFGSKGSELTAPVQALRGARRPEPLAPVLEGCPWRRTFGGESGDAGVV